MADKLRIDNQAITANEIRLTQGWHSLCAEYLNTTKTNYKNKTGAFRDFRPRGAVVLLPVSSTLPPKPSIYAEEVAMVWTHANHLPFDPYQGKYKRWNYRFRSVPGLEEMTFALRGTDLKVWVDGQELPTSAIQTIDKKSDEINFYQVALPEKEQKIREIAFSVTAHTGYQGTAVIAEPVKLKTGKGLLHAGDWSKTGALRCYSGGMIYKKSFQINKEQQQNNIELDLGNVIATCEVKVNGKPMGILMSPPYRLNITPAIQEGANEIEVLVYSTLANHYQTQPTPYRGDPQAGLIGPVTLSFFKK